MENNTLPNNLVGYGPDTNCTLQLCPLEASALGYRPSPAASGIFISLFALTMVIHIAQGFHWKAWGFMVAMLLGCVDEIAGYSGRVMLYYNPFSFVGFLLSQICITTAPVFFCAAIYVTLSRTICYLDPTISRFNPKLIYWISITSDIISLSLQGAGGGISSTTSSSSKLGENTSLAGLCFQVFTLVIFVFLAVDYLFRFCRIPGQAKTTFRLKMYLGFMLFSIVLILGRCVYRIDELKDGYSGALFHNQSLFCGFESVFVVVAIFCLNLGHPGVGMPRTQKEDIATDVEANSGSDKHGETESFPLQRRTLDIVLT